MRHHDVAWSVRGQQQAGSSPWCAAHLCSQGYSDGFTAPPGSTSGQCELSLGWGRLMSATVLIMLLVTGAHCGSPAGVVLGTGDRVTVCAMLCHGLTAPHSHHHSSAISLLHGVQGVSKPVLV